jgi:hypothetical protein
VRPFGQHACDDGHMTLGPKSSRIEISMNLAFKRILVLALTLSTIPWVQGEVCPMQMQVRNVHACGAPAANAHGAMHHHPTSSSHDCCPKGKVEQATEAQCPPVQISACNSAMTCCSVDPQPASAPQKATVTDRLVAVGVPDTTKLPGLVRFDFSKPTPASLIEIPVSRLKEDLRV